MNHFDAIVVGVGGVGSAALRALAKAGLHVLGLEQFKVGHARGSSHGETRVIRKAYFEHPSYVPLLQRSYALWDELEEEQEVSLFERCGVVQVGASDGPVIQGVLESARVHDLDVEALDSEGWASVCPHMRLPDGMVALYERDSGFLRVEECVRAQARSAIQKGATLLQGEQVVSFSKKKGVFHVQSSADSYSADRLVVCAGAWTAPLLCDLGVSLRVQRKVLLWCEAGEVSWRNAPVFLYDFPHRVIYGFPLLDGRVKIAEHSGGQDAHPDALDRALYEADREGVETFSKRWLRGIGPIQEHAVCMYTHSPDGHFLVGEHPGREGLFLAAGLSGHGFKFAPVLGEILANEALGVKSALDISFLSPARFGGQA